MTFSKAYGFWIHTCEDCIHYNLCKALNDGGQVKLLSPEECDCFEDKADFVKFEDRSNFVKYDEILGAIKEAENHFSHICKSQKEAREETCRYEGVLYVKQKLEELNK